MSIRGIYNSDGITEYTVADQKNIHSKSFGGKVIYGNTALVVSAQSTPNMTVKISSGECSVNGAILQNTASTNLTIASNSASYVRIDAIVAYISGTTYELKVLQGTPSAAPTAPDCTANTYVKLAEVTVGVGVTSIQSSNIKDCRNEQLVLPSSLAEMVKEAYDRPYVIKSSYSTNPSYRVWSDGYKEVWGSGILSHTQGGNYDKVFTWSSTGITFKDYLNASVDFRFQNQSNTTWLSGNNFVNIRMDSGSEIRLVILNLTAMVGTCQWKVSGY